MYRGTKYHYGIAVLLIPVPVHRVRRYNSAKLDRIASSSSGNVRMPNPDPNLDPDLDPNLDPDLDSDLVCNCKSNADLQP